MITKAPKKPSNESVKSTTAPKKDRRKKKKDETTKVSKSSEDREVLYGEVEVRLCIGKDALTCEQAMELLGWQELPEGAKDEAGNEIEPDLYDYNQKPIKLWNNTGNRVFSPPLALAYAVMVLEKQWKLNGQTMVIGRSGLTLSCQHRLVGLILAVQHWEDDKDKWFKWDTEPTMETLLVFGIDESDDVVNTIDTGKPRSLTDIIYRSTLFEDLSTKDRLKAARMADYAIRLLWKRTGAVAEAFSPLRTHAESLDFLNRHEKLLECVRFILELDDEKGISNYITPGFAAGLLYMMGSSTTNRQEYTKTTPYTETAIDWDYYELACSFFEDLKEGKFASVKNALTKVMTDNDGVAGVDDRIGILVKSWNLFSQKKPVVKVSLRYEKDEDGFNTLVEFPTCGGIDIGVTPDENVEGSEEGETEEEQTPPKSSGKRGKKPAEIPTPEEFVPPAINDRVIVVDDEGNWHGKYIGRRRVKGVLWGLVISEDNKQEYEVPYDSVSKVEFDPGH